MQREITAQAAASALLAVDSPAGSSPQVFPASLPTSICTRRSPSPAGAPPGHPRKPFAFCWAWLAPHSTPSPAPTAGMIPPQLPAGFRAFSTPSQTPAGPCPHLSSPSPQVEESRAPQPFGVSSSLFLLAQLPYKDPRATARANFQQEPGAGLTGEDYTRLQELGGSSAETEASLGPSQPGQVQGWRRSLRWEQELQDGNRSPACPGSAQIPSLSSGRWPWDTGADQGLSHIPPWGGVEQWEPGPHLPQDTSTLQSRCRSLCPWEQGRSTK